MTPEITLRPATHNDIPQILEIALGDGTAAHWSAQQWVDLFDPQAPPRLILVAVRAGVLPKVCGFLVALHPPAGREGGDCELENVAVAEAMRRHGIGRRLLQALAEDARAHHAARLLLEVRRSNQAAIALYLSEGFRLLAARRGYYHDPIEDALIMVQEF